MVEAQREKYRNIIGRASGSTDPADFGAMELVYSRVRAANESFLQKNASALRQNQADSLRRLLEEVIDDHRFHLSEIETAAPVGYPVRSRRAPYEAGDAGRSAGWRSVLAFVMLLAAAAGAVYAYLDLTAPFIRISAVDFREKPGLPAAQTAWNEPWPWTKVPLLARLDGRQSRLNAVKRDGDLYTIVADDPQLVYDLKDLAVSGRDASYLGLDFSCLDQRAEPKLQVFWWGDGQAGPEPQPRAAFAVRDGRVMVPLAASGSWASLAAIKGVRIDVEPANACAAIRVGDVGLYGPDV